jgi:hypothetical protein
VRRKKKRENELGRQELFRVNERSRHDHGRFLSAKPESIAVSLDIARGAASLQQDGDEAGLEGTSVRE